jgi:exosortase A-associated hydrolase 2
MNAPFHLVPRVEPFFYDVDPGTRFCLYHAPDPEVAPRGAMLYIHPFAEELNLCRRMAAQQARAFAAMGFAVLQIDLFGCGDSCGEFADGRWEQWRRDLAVAAHWLAQRQPGPLYLWGVRLGALLAMEMAAERKVEGLVLWQPMISGRTCINQFLRQEVVMRPEDIAAGDLGRAARAGIRHLRAELAARGRIDVAGYELDLGLARSIEAVEATQLDLHPCSVHWFSSSAMPRRLSSRWDGANIALHYHHLEPLPFWSDPARPECPALLAATTAAFEGGAS